MVDDDTQHQPLTSSCKFMLTHICTRECTHEHIHICTEYLYMSTTYVHMNEHMNRYIHMYMCIFTHLPICVHMNTYTNTYAKCAQVSLHIYPHMYT